jgi:hypothetical protein
MENLEKEIAEPVEEPVEQDEENGTRRPSRRTRARRPVQQDEETKKQDDEFWKNNPLFKGTVLKSISMKRC